MSGALILDEAPSGVGEAVDRYKGEILGALVRRALEQVCFPTEG